VSRDCCSPLVFVQFTAIVLSRLILVACVMPGGRTPFPGPMTAAVAGSAAASYSTGGGVVLEHQYGATLLASLLTGDPVPELGDDVTPMAVRFQASAVSGDGSLQGARS
jgi:hypothetical protein